MKLLSFVFNTLDRHTAPLEVLSMLPPSLKEKAMTTSKPCSKQIAFKIPLATLNCMGMYYKNHDRIFPTQVFYKSSTPKGKQKQPKANFATM